MYIYKPKTWFIDVIEDSVQEQGAVENIWAQEKGSPPNLEKIVNFVTCSLPHTTKMKKYRKLRWAICLA